MVTLLGSLIGFISAAFPDLLKIWRDAADRKHELTILEMQMAQAAQGHQQRLEEITEAVARGATEIDMVIKREYVLTGQWDKLYDDVRQCREACGDHAHLKTILAIGDLGTMTNVAKASIISMMAGSDFIKTSTGKEGVNATFPVALVMIRCIREYYERTGIKVGFKPAGGIRSAKDTLSWLALMKDELGDEWTQPHLFRIGASSLLGDIERQLYHFVNGKYAAAHQFPSA